MLIEIELIYTILLHHYIISRLPCIVLAAADICLLSTLVILLTVCTVPSRPCSVCNYW